MLRSFPPITHVRHLSVDALKSTDTSRLSRLRGDQHRILEFALQSLRSSRPRQKPPSTVRRFSRSIQVRWSGPTSAYSNPWPNSAVYFEYILTDCGAASRFRLSQVLGTQVCNEDIHAPLVDLACEKLLSLSYICVPGNAHQPLCQTPC